MFRFFVAHHVKLPRASNTKTGRAVKISHRTVGARRTTTRTVNAPKRW